MLYLLMLIFLIYETNSICNETQGTEIHCYQNNCYNYPNDITNVVKNATITCTNIDSIAEIKYPSIDQNYSQFLIIKESNISTIHSMELYKFSMVVTLRLSHLHIRTISPGAFTEMTKLKELYLDNNELTELSNGVYNTLHSLEILNLTNNKIQRIENVAIVGLTVLKQLLLGNNELSKFDNVFGKLKNLTILDLSFNRISKIDFAHIPKTKDLNLSNNEISKLDNCQMLRTLNLHLENNELDKLDQRFEEILRIYLGYNKLHSIEKFVFGNPKSLLVLDLRYNYLSKFDEELFHDFTSLTTLNLQHNNVNKVDLIWFRNLSELTILDLSENGIQEFQYGVFDCLKKLEILNISGNELSNLNQYTLSFLTTLQRLYFDNNKISSFDANDLVVHLRNLKIVSLDNNFWKCKELVQITKRLEISQVEVLSGHVHDGPNVKGIACFNPEESFSANISKLDFQEIAQNVEMAISDGFKNSKMDKFFNEDFKNSKFARYFDKDYIQSSFFSYLNNMKFLVTKQENLNGSTMEKLTAFQTTPQESTSKILVLSVVVQVLTLSVLMFALYVGFTFVKKSNLFSKQDLSSQMELC